MNNIYKLCFLLILFLPFSLFSEGTKELRPEKSNKGNLHLSKKNQFTKFAQYNCPVEDQLKLRVASTTETIYFGFNNRKEGGGFVSGVPFRVKSPSGEIVFTGTMPDSTEEGYIKTWEEAVAGPAELGSVQGYNALSIAPEEPGDYIFEFDLSDLAEKDEIQIHLFDITIADEHSNKINGRLHSKGWQLSTEGYDNPFHGKVYPYGKDGAVYEVDFNGAKPYSFFINFNSLGTGNTGNHQEDRKSKIGNLAFPEYDVFLNPPDVQVYPTQVPEIRFTGKALKKDCSPSEFCLSFQANTEGYLEGYIDINQNQQFDTSGADISFTGFLSANQELCIPWDGKDRNGMTSNVHGAKIFSRFKYGIMHFPIYDMEHNTQGFKVKQLRPEVENVPLLFWDDSQITKGSTEGDLLVNLSGCKAETSGCHKWKDRGNVDDSSIESQETINTWWFNSITEHWIITDTNQMAKISYDPFALSSKDTTLCGSASLNLHVYNDRLKHADTTRYQYIWSINGERYFQDGAVCSLFPDQPSEVVLKAESKTVAGCITSDTISVKVLAIKELSVPPHDCGMEVHPARVFISSTPHPVSYSWNQTEWSSNPEHLLAPGKNYLSIKFEGHPCTIDTVFSVYLKGMDFSLEIKHEQCSSGNGSIKLISPVPHYRLVAISGIQESFGEVYNLKAGIHKVSINHLLDPFCRLDSLVTINNDTFSYTPEIRIIGTDSSPIEAGEFLSLETNVSSLSRIIWNFGDGNTSFSLNPVHKYESPGRYLITMIFKDSSGCEGQAERETEIVSTANCKMVCPTAFSPNGDGINDKFRILGDPTSFKLQIFNRWGEIIFLGDENSTEWDGRFEGIPVPAGVYPFILNYECYDHTGSLVQKQEKGTVTVVR